MPLKLVVGCGYLGFRVAQLWHARGAQVVVITRSPVHAVKLSAAGYSAIVADVTDPRSLAAVSQFAPFETVLYAVSFDRTSGKSMRDVYVGGLQNLLAALPDGIGRFINISTIGVYGQNDGSWIDEESLCTPVSESGRLFLEAEGILRQHPLGNRTIVLRLAGLYGPDRIPNRQDLLAGSPIGAAPDAYLNLIHVDDAARIVLAVEEQAQPPRTFVVSDGHPVIRREYYAEAARLLGAPPPTFALSSDRDFTTQRGNTNKRVNNARLTREVRFELRHPTYHHGLAASIK